MANEVQKVEEAGKKQLSPFGMFNATITAPGMQKYIGEILKEKKPIFVNNVVALVANNTLLQKCDPKTVIYSALKATALDLAIDPALGQAWVIPYGTQAQFQLGARGVIQLALRSGKFTRLNVAEVKEGELKENNVITGDIVIEPLPGREKLKTIGYVAYFRLTNGFEKMIYHSTEELLAHGKRFSKTFSSGPWKTDPDAMMKKTILKELLNKWAPLSAQDAALTEGLRYDQAVISEENGEPVYVDAPTQEERVAAMVDEQKQEMKASGKKPDELL